MPAVPYTAILTASATLNFGELDPSLSTVYQDLTVSVPGAAAGDAVIVTPPHAVASESHVFYTAWVSSADTVTVRANHLFDGGVAINPSSGTFRVTVIKP